MMTQLISRTSIVIDCNRTINNAMVYNGNSYYYRPEEIDVYGMSLGKSLWKIHMSIYMRLSKMDVRNNKKFWEELIAYFLLIRHAPQRI
jgi:hypothetical protein